MSDNPSMNGFCEDEPEPEVKESVISMLYTDDPKANFLCGTKGFDKESAQLTDDFMKDTKKDFKEAAGSALKVKKQTFYVEQKVLIKILLFLNQKL